MARITVEDCLERVESRFALVILAMKRGKMLLRGAKPLVSTDNKTVVIALREIAAGRVSCSYGPGGGETETEGSRVKLVEGDETETKRSRD